MLSFHFFYFYITLIRLVIISLNDIFVERSLRTADCVFEFRIPNSAATAKYMRPMNTIDTLLFDFDGTLADTYPIIFYAFQGIFKEFKNSHISGKEIVAMFGPSEDEIIRSRFTDVRDSSLVIERYYDLYDSQHSLLVKPLSAITLMLQDLKNRGYKLGIVTGKGRRSLNISMSHLFPQEIFETTIAATMECE